jgi:putative transposase
MDILTVFACFETLVSAVSGRRLAVMTQAILTIPGRITMLSLSRWTGSGGSYRTIQRFFCDQVAVGSDVNEVL